MSGKRIKELEDLIVEHKALYYQGRPEITDLEYDSLEDELKKLDPANHVLSMVGTLSSSLDKIKHESKMLSLDKTYVYGDLKKWQGANELVSTYKIDGVSCSLVYENGELVLGKTRGDGIFGENITTKIMWMDTVLKKIEDKSNKVEIRGELYCREKEFFKLAQEMEKIGLDKPTSQRNIVAGLISRKENLELCRYISFQAFDYLNIDNEFGTEMEKIKSLDSLGFLTPSANLHKDSAKLEETIEDARLFMSEGDYQIDGLVFTLNKIKKHAELGYTNHHPRFKMAFKFKGESKTTRLNKIEWSVSRNGILTPVGMVEPVDLSGAKISRVTLHNYGMVKVYNLKEGDEIEIIRSGEVIPKFLSVKKDSGNPFVAPNECPECGSKTEIVDIRIVCSNPDCKARVKEQILNFIKKIGIDDLSIKRLEQLMEKGLVKKIPDLYRLTREDFITLDKTKEKLAEKMFSNIQQSKSADLTTFVSALGITHGAYNTCEKIISSGFNSLDKLFSLTVSELSKLDSFAEKSSTDFLHSLNSKKSLIEELLQAGFSFDESEKPAQEKPLEGRKICITGALSEKRSIVEGKIRELGGIVTGSVSKNTDLLLTNEQTSKSSKFVKARKLGIDVIDEETFFITYKN